jgi:hypothetical protein
VGDCEFENNFVLVDEVECIFYDQTFTTPLFHDHVPSQKL